MAKKVDPAQETEEIISRLDILAEYQAMGVRFVGEPRGSGAVECFAAGRDERKPSAFVNVNTGLYCDSGGDREKLSLFDFAVKYGNQGFRDWKEARQHYAEVAGVKLSKSGGAKKNPLDSLELLDWKYYETLAELWCHKYKPGVTVEALKLAGAVPARYPCWRNKNGEKQLGKYTCVALPCYGDKLLAGGPVAYVIWNMTGPTLELFRGKGVPPTEEKMLSIGLTRGTLMNQFALSRLSDPAVSPTIEWVWKSGGPSDMLTLQASIPPDRRDTHLVITNASSETGDVLPNQVAILAGQRVLVAHDADEAGEVGALKWLTALKGVASEARQVRLPWAVQRKSGKDIRDYLRGVPFDLPQSQGDKDVASHDPVTSTIAV